MHDHETWWSIFSDPNHIIAEMLWTIIQDVIVVWLLYNVVFKRHILPKIHKDVHRHIDEEHGIEHTDDEER